MYKVKFTISLLCMKLECDKPVFNKILQVEIVSISADKLQ